MLSLVTKFQKSLSRDGKNLNHFKFVNERQAILKLLSIAMTSGKVIGVYARVLGEGMFLTGVSYISDEKIIDFETYDLSGQILTRTKISLDEIKMVCQFDQDYVNPLLGRSHTASR